MKPKYLETYDYLKFRDYCSNKCINIVYEQNDKEDKEKNELRGRYKGYLYAMKVFSSLYNRKKRVMNYEIYNHFKYYKSHKSQLWGESKSILDVMNLISNEYN